MTHKLREAIAAEQAQAAIDTEAAVDGAFTNMDESFLSRLRRAEIGTHHHIAGAYLSAYAAEMAWREDNRRVSNGEQFLMTGRAALGHPVSRTWRATGSAASRSPMDYSENATISYRCSKKTGSIF